MKINNISITNYRSISNLTINLKEISEKCCHIFLGKNETGKSNILKAISFLDEDTSFDYETDCNKTAKKKSENISIDFNLNIDEFNLIDNKKISSFHLPEVFHDKIVINNIVRKIYINSFDERKDFVWIYIDENDIFSKYIYASETMDYYKISEIYDGEEVITKNNLATILGDEYKFVDKLYVEKILESELYSTINKSIPKIIYWKPSVEYMINSPIDLNIFSADQTTSIPLKNIFKISGIDDIDKRISIIEDSTEERRELEEELTTSITNYINTIWPEHKINLIVDIENMQCKVLIEDKDDKKPKYKMEQRSDGFKQFISILLSLSIESNTKQLKDKIILLDEPEVHLHPSGVRYLREELLNISFNNTVLVSSHSIYMVDKLNLDRHFKVEKQKSHTNIKQINKNNPYEEEVIYEALGTSIYEHIKPNMLVFEGKTDKDIFDNFTYKFRTDIKPVELGTISADGVEKIPQYTKFISGKFVNGFILTDSDNDGSRIKDYVIKNSVSFNKNNSFEINDIVQTNVQATLEDLYPKEVIIEIVKSQSGIDIELNNKAVIKQLEAKSRSTKGKINVKKIKGDLVNYIISDISKLTKQKTKDKYPMYFDFLITLHNKFKVKK